MRSNEAVSPNHRTRSRRGTAARALAAVWITLVAAPASGGPDAAGTRAPTDPARPVTYFRAERVAKSFAQGAVLYAADTNYMIHTSRRTAPGMAEVHTRDTDLIYVLEGEVTFVTGGRVVDAKSTAPDEIRGASIEGGESRSLAAGDVIIVPAGTPHWFREVRGPVHYYTIKVRGEDQP